MAAAKATAEKPSAVADATPAPFGAGVAEVDGGMPSLPKAEPDRVALLSVLADGTPDQHEPELLAAEGEEQ